MTENPLRGDASITFSGAGNGAASMYTLTSGAEPIRNASWTLEARSAGSQWQVIDQRSGEAFAWARQTRPFRIAQPAAHAEYRLRLESRDHLRLAEVELLAPGSR